MPVSAEDYDLESTLSPDTFQSASLKIFGNVSAPDFPNWIINHAHKLGLHSISTSLHADYLDVHASGQDEMLNALALACSLGPQSALVDHVAFTIATHGAPVD